MAHEFTFGEALSRIDVTRKPPDQRRGWDQNCREVAEAARELEKAFFENSD
jgi:hypothetical protein